MFSNFIFNWINYYDTGGLAYPDDLNLGGGGAGWNGGTLIFDFLEGVISDN